MLKSSRQSSTFAIEALEARSLLSVSLLADINAGSGSSLPENFNVVGNQVLFLSYDSTRGQMLWASNGTPTGTYLVKDINPNPQNGMYQGAGGDSIVIGNEMYFTGVDPTHGVELWKTDGTTTGTQLVSDLNSGPDDSDPSGFMNFGGKLAFSAMGQLWISDGTSAGTISLGTYYPTGDNGTIDRMAVLGNSLYFMRYNPADTEGRSTGELWKTDGTVAGTQMVVDVSPGTSGDQSIAPEASDLINVNGKLYFAADDGVHGWELWKSDGTAAGTSMVDDLAPPPPTGFPVDGSYPSDLTDVNGSLYFIANPNYTAQQLYTLDSTTGQPVLVDPIASGGPTDPTQLVAAGDGVFFTTYDGSGENALWFSNGSSTSTSQIADINSGGTANISEMMTVGDTLYFSADDGTHGAELWSSDGTASGTAMAADVNPGADSSSPGQFTAFGASLLFNAELDSFGEEPFVFTPAASTPIAPITPTDPVAPSAPVASLAGSFSGGVSTDPMPVLSGTAPASSTVYLFADGVTIGKSVAGSDGEFQVGASAPLRRGTHELTLSDKMNGVASAATSPITFTVAAVHPSVSFVSAAASSITLKFTEDVSAGFGRGDFTLTDIDTGVRISKANIRISYNAKKNTATIFFKGMKSDALGTGHYRLRIAAADVTDTAGNDLSSDESFGFTIRKKK